MKIRVDDSNLDTYCQWGECDYSTSKVVVIEGLPSNMLPDTYHYFCKGHLDDFIERTKTFGLD